MEQNLIAWLNTLQPWLVKIINSEDDLDSRETIEKGADLCVQQLKNEIEKQRVTRSVEDEGNHSVVIEKIHSTSNLFALRDNAYIEFNPAITVIYGPNGTGKTSLVKLFEYASGGIVDLAGNKFKNKKGLQTYTIDYLDNGQTRSFVLNENEDRIDLDIYDGENGVRLLNDDKEISVESIELKIIHKITKYCDNVKQELKDRSNNLLQSRKIGDVPIAYKETDAGNTFISLSEADSDQIDKAFVGIEWTEKHQQELDKLIAELDIENRYKTAKRIELDIKTSLDAKNTIEKILCRFSREALEELNIQKKNWYANYIASQQYAEEVFEKTELGEIGSDTWKKMWESAREYSKEAYHNDAFPVVEDDAVCVLCHQPLNNDAKKRLLSFEQFVKSSFEDELKETQNLVEENALLSIMVNTELLNSQIKQVLNDERTIDRVIAELGEISRWQKEQKQVDKPFRELSFLNCKKLITRIDNLIIDLKSKLDKLVNDERIKEKESQRKLLEGQRWIASQEGMLRKNAAILSEANLLVEASKLTATNKLTKRAKAVSETVLTEKYEAAFNKALDELRATNLHARLVAGKASKGRGSFRIVLENSEGERISANDVLSTGEQRIVSLAAFIADAVNNANTIPFIFDDPVSSLDCDYEERVAHALLALSRERQVIIFTHRLSLLAQLNLAGNGTVLELYKTEPIGCGNVVKDPVLAISRRSALKTALKSVKKNLEDLDREAKDNPELVGYRDRLDGIAAKFRTMVESSIELVLLNEIVIRFKKEVHSSKVMDLATIDIDDCKLVDMLMSKYSEKAHSQSEEAPARSISSTEIIGDINRLLDLIKKQDKKNS